jgi:hypothetical protein
VRQVEGVARIRAQATSGKPTTPREFLLRRDPAWLADELLRIADANPLVAARLKAAAGANRAGLVDLSRLRRELDTAIFPGGFIEYGAAWKSLAMDGGTGSWSKRFPPRLEDGRTDS